MSDLSHSGIKSSVLDQIRDLALQYGMDKVILFGSRARGDWRRESDIDLAVSGGDADLFRVAVEEDTDTLLTFDVVCLDGDVQEKLRQVIESEGILVYEKV